MSFKNRSLSGVAGTYYVVAELSRKNIIALITARNTKGFDMIASNFELGRSVFIEVKTDGSEQGFWAIGTPVVKNDFYYVLVSIIGKNPPKFYIVPSENIYAKYALEMKEKAQYMNYNELNNEDKNEIIERLNSKKSH